MKWQKFENEAKTQVLERVLAARPTNLAELQATVKFARSANLTIRAAGSSHSWSPLFTEENQMLVYVGDVTYDDICKSRLHINHQVGLSKKCVSQCIIGKILATDHGTDMLKKLWP